MPKKTLYVREEDQDIWDKAETLSDSESLSSVVTAALRRYVLSKENGGLYERIELMADGRKVAFQGRLVFEKMTHTISGFGIYETAKKQLLVFKYHLNGTGPMSEREKTGTYQVFKDIDHLANESKAQEAWVVLYQSELDEIATELGAMPHIEELDI